MLSVFANASVQIPERKTEIPSIANIMKENKVILGVIEFYGVYKWGVPTNRRSMILQPEGRWGKAGMNG